MTGKQHIFTLFLLVLTLLPILIAAAIMIPIVIADDGDVCDAERISNTYGDQIAKASSLEEMATVNQDLDDTLRRCNMTLEQQVSPQNLP